MLNKAIKVLDDINEFTTTVAGTIATIMLMIMTAIVAAHVVLRYGFNYSMVWTEETARFLMVWMTFLYFPTGHKRGLNVAVDFLVAGWRNSRPGLVLRICVEFTVAVLALVCINLSLSMVGRGMTTLSQSLQLPMAWVYAVLPVCFLLTFLCSLEQLLRLGKQIIEGSDSGSSDADPKAISCAN